MHKTNTHEHVCVWHARVHDGMQICVTGMHMLATCGAREVRVDDFLRVRIEVYEHSQNELARCDRVPLRSCVQGGTIV